VGASRQAKCSDLCGLLNLLLGAQVVKCRIRLSSHVL